ncbi:unnamed protein product [Closterium sp. Naga37s-1]|nr:unnamed protein product [Closterium sp. Naga37s-1]
MVPRSASSEKPAAGKGGGEGGVPRAASYRVDSASAAVASAVAENRGESGAGGATVGDGVSGGSGGGERPRSGGSAEGGRSPWRSAVAGAVGGGRTGNGVGTLREGDIGPRPDISARDSGSQASNQAQQQQQRQVSQKELRAAQKEQRMQQRQARALLRKHAGAQAGGQGGAQGSAQKGSHQRSASGGVPSSRTGGGGGGRGAGGGRGGGSGGAGGRGSHVTDKVLWRFEVKPGGGVSATSATSTPSPSKPVQSQAAGSLPATPGRAAGQSGSSKGGGGGGGGAEAAGGGSSLLGQRTFSGVSASSYVGLPPSASMPGPSFGGQYSGTLSDPGGPGYGGYHHRAMPSDSSIDSWQGGGSGLIYGLAPAAAAGAAAAASPGVAAAGGAGGAGGGFGTVDGAGAGYGVPPISPHALSTLSSSRSGNFSGALSDAGGSPLGSVPRGAFAAAPSAWSGGAAAAPGAGATAGGVGGGESGGSLLRLAPNELMAALMQQQPGMMLPSPLQPSLLQPSLLLPNQLQPSLLQPSLLQPSLLQPSLLQPSLLQPSLLQALQPGPSTLPASADAPPAAPNTAFAEPAASGLDASMPAGMEANTYTYLGGNREGEDRAGGDADVDSVDDDRDDESQDEGAESEIEGERVEGFRATIRAKAGIEDGLMAYRQDKSENASESCAVLLDALLDICESTFGFIASNFRMPHGDPCLKTHAITNILWTDKLRTWFADHSAAGLVFTDVSETGLFGRAALRGEAVWSDDPPAGSLPKGHPRVNTAFAMPLICGTAIVGVAVVANRIGGYSHGLLRAVQPLLSLVASLLFCMHWRNDGGRDLRRRVVSLAQDGRIEVDGRGHITCMDAAACAIFGVNPLTAALMAAAPATSATDLASQSEEATSAKAPAAGCPPLGQLSVADLFARIGDQPVTADVDVEELAPPSPSPPFALTPSLPYLPAIAQQLQTPHPAVGKQQGGAHILLQGSGAAVGSLRMTPHPAVGKQQGGAHILLQVDLCPRAVAAQAADAADAAGGSSSSSSSESRVHRAVVRLLARSD